MFLISGITGKVGGTAARELLSQGKKIRALVRDLDKAAEWQALGAELVAGDLTDPEALERALQGVNGAFIMQPTPMGVEPDFPEAHALIASAVTALRKAPPPRLVILSSVGSEQSHGLGNIMQTHLLEEALKDFSFPIAVVRAGAFLENNLHGLARAGSTGYFDSFLQPTDRKFPMVATRDIGRQVAELLLTGWTGRKVIELGSYYSPDDLAAAMSEALGTPVQARAIPREQWTERLAMFGLPPSKIGPWEEMQDGFNSGWIDFGRPGTEAVPGRTTPVELFSAVGKQ